MSLRLEELSACLQGVVPAILATCGRDGEPNVTYVSQLHFVDARHVALSCQFFNKTRRNIGENPHVVAEVYDPRSFEAYRLRLRYLRSETSGPLFETMAARIQVIASHTGMAGIFRLISSDVCEVLAIEPVADYLLPAEDAAVCGPEGLVAGPLTELRGLQLVSDRIARACTLERLLASVLEALDQVFGFAHAMVFVPDESGQRLVALASRGYGEAGIGGEVAVGEGLVGTVAARRRMVRLTGVGGELRYGRAVRGRVAASGAGAQLTPELPLPGLPDAQAQLGLPLLVGDALVGVLAVESRDALAFDEWDEAFLQIVANQFAMGIDRMQEDDDAPVPAAELAAAAGAAPAPRARSFVYYRNDDCIFVDGEYLIRNVPAKILWKLLREHRRTGQREFSNRELRLDPSLGLPDYRDNLESRLILLRRRLEAKCPEVRLVPVRRGRFALELLAHLELAERDSSA